MKLLLKLITPSINNMFDSRTALALTIGSLLLYLLTSAIRTMHHRKALTAQYGCEPVPSFREPFSLFSTSHSPTIDSLDDIVFPRFRKHGYTHLRTTKWGLSKLWTAAPENIQAIHKGKFTDYQKVWTWKPSFSPVISGEGGGGLIISDGEAWRKSRRAVAPLFRGSHVTDVAALETHVQAIFEEFGDSESGWTKELDVWKVCSAFSMGSTVDFLFGANSNTKDYLPDGPDKNKRSVVDVFSKVLRGGLLRFKADALYWTVYPKGFTEVCQAARSFTDGFIAEAIYRRDTNSPHVHECNKHPLFLDAMVKSVSSREVRDEAITLLFAGQESTSGLLSFALILLSRHKDVFTRLRADILMKFGKNGSVTQEGILKVEYLRWVLNETLRLYGKLPTSLSLQHTQY
jgi:cytochrome P450